MIELIKPQRGWLCEVVEGFGAAQGVVGLDFDRYDEQRRLVPGYVLTAEQSQVIMRVEGAAFREACEGSRVGESLVVTFTSPWGRGWFKLKWAKGRG
jgi:hypothetical protein